jgi:hypothetical protein
MLGPLVSPFPWIIIAHLKNFRLKAFRTVAEQEQITTGSL